RHHGRPMFYSGYAVARALHHRFVFLPTLDRRVRAGLAYKMDIVLCSRGRNFAVDFNQAAEHSDWRAAGLSRVSAFQILSVSKSSPVDLCHDRAFAGRALVRPRL